MSAHDAVATISRLTDALVGSSDVGDVLAGLVAACAEELGFGAVALMAHDDDRRLSLLSATSHRAVELEMLQIQQTTGPCVECIATGTSLVVVGAGTLEERWPDVGPAVTAAGFDVVAAFPMRWRGRTVGGLNLFGNGTDPFDEPGFSDLAQLFADLCALAIIATGPESVDRLADRLRDARLSRDLVEQAKGVLAYRLDIDLDGAYGRLLSQSHETGVSLTRTAQDVIDEQVAQRPGTDPR